MGDRYLVPGPGVEGIGQAELVVLDRERKGRAAAMHVVRSRAPGMESIFARRRPSARRGGPGCPRCSVRPGHSYGPPAQDQQHTVITVVTDAGEIPGTPSASTAHRL